MNCPHRKVIGTGRHIDDMGSASGSIGSKDSAPKLVGSHTVCGIGNIVGYGISTVADAEHTQQ